jgi:tripartite-type tricarboxylate transporter receptor subunit TctC
MPGAGSLTSVRYLESARETGAATIGIFNPGLIILSLVDPKLVGLNFTKLTWIGVVSPDYQVCYGYGPAGVKSWDDLMSRKRFILGAAGKGAGNYINGAILRVILHAPVQQIVGFPGASDRRLAIERGELEGDCGEFDSIPRSWITSEKAHVFVRFNKKRPTDMPEGAKYINSFARTQEQRSMLDFLDSVNELGRPFVVSPTTPAPIVAELRQAFDATMDDKAFQADMEKAHFPVAPVSGKDAQKLVMTLTGISPDLLSKATEIYQ